MFSCSEIQQVGREESGFVLFASASFVTNKGGGSPTGDRPVGVERGWWRDAEEVIMDSLWKQEAALLLKFRSCDSAEDINNACRWETSDGILSL